MLLSSTLHDTRRIHLAIVRDLFDYRLVERENRLLATALNHAGEAVAITDAAGLIVYVNRAFEEITGFINLYSEVGLGTTFRFYLPAAAVEGVLARTPAAVDLVTLRGRGETILVAEDDAQVLAVATRVLGQANYRVLAARDGVEALEVYTAHAGPIHLALVE